MVVQAMVMIGPGRPIERRRFPAPHPEGGAVLEMVASEVCGTDVHLHHGRLAGVPYPIIPGHVSCGRIMETRGTLVDVEGRPIEPGRLVTFYDVFGTCGACWHCLVAKAATRYRAVAMMARHDGRFRWRELVTREYPLLEVAQALEDMERLAVVKAVIRPE